ncbi:integrase family protein [Puniceibacterium sp. IMCC21224]|nr:integrase family protein [Puniceibacterium sp. IMCC21224]
MFTCTRGGFFLIDIAEVQTVEGKLYLFVGIDRTSKFAVTQLVDKADRKTAWEFLEHLLKAVPYRIHTILTDNGIQFAEQPGTETQHMRGRCAST